MDVTQLITACKAALKEDLPTKSVREAVTRAVSNEKAAIKALGKLNRGGVNKIFVSDELTILNIVWSPGLKIMPHNIICGL